MIGVLGEFAFLTLILGLICFRSSLAAYVCTRVCVRVCKKRNTKKKTCHLPLKPPAGFPLCTLRIVWPGASLMSTVFFESDFERMKGNWATLSLAPIVAPCQNYPHLCILSVLL